jgi:hypothetical protein
MQFAYPSPKYGVYTDEQVAAVPRSPRRWSMDDSSNSAHSQVSDRSRAHPAPSDEKEAAALGAWLADFKERMQSKCNSADAMHQKRADEYARELDRREFVRQQTEALAREAASRQVDEERAAEEDARVALEREHTRAARDTECRTLNPEERHEWEADQAELDRLEAQLAAQNEHFATLADLSDRGYSEFVCREQKRVHAEHLVKANREAKAHLARSLLLWETYALADCDEMINRASVLSEEQIARIPLAAASAHGVHHAAMRARDRVMSQLPEGDRAMLYRHADDAAYAREHGDETTALEILARRDSILDDLVEMEALRSRSKTLRALKQTV